MQLHCQRRVVAFRISPVIGIVLASPVASNVSWRVVGVDEEGHECGPSSEHDCPLDAGVFLFGAYESQKTESTGLALRYADIEATAVDTTASGFGDRLAEVMWDHIEAHEDLPDHPEDYGHSADDHPLDALRSGFLTAADIL